MDTPQYHLEGVIRTRDETMENFDGPLDVILLLLSKNKIEIQDISITSILEQYLAYLEEMKRMDMEITSEFIAMASHLMLIKTKMLLSAAEQAEALSEMELLIRSLEERQRKDAYEHIKESAKFLEERNELGLGLFVKEPEPLKRDGTYRYQHAPEDLVAAMTAIADRSANQLPPPVANFNGIVGAEPYPVGKKAAQLLKRLLSFGVTKFRNLFRGSRSRSEIVATFLAVLELCRQRSVTIGDDSGLDTEVTYLGEPQSLPEEPEN
jgi:segregation and condensation protein A